MHALTCDYCGKPFCRQHRNAVSGNYCSPRCSALDHRRRADFVCAGCGVTFTCQRSRRPGKEAFCSAPCWSRTVIARRRAKHAAEKGGENQGAA